MEAWEPELIDFDDHSEIFYDHMMLDDNIHKLDERSKDFDHEFLSTLKSINQKGDEYVSSLINDFAGKSNSEPEDILSLFDLNDINNSFDPIVVSPSRESYLVHSTIAPDYEPETAQNATNVKELYKKESRLYPKGVDSTSIPCINQESMPNQNFHNTSNLLLNKNLALQQKWSNDIVLDKVKSSTKTIKSKAAKKSTNKSTKTALEYRDLSLMKDEEAVAKLNYQSMIGRSTEPFPFKLHLIVERSVIDGYSSIISWMLHGRAFRIHDHKLFAEKIMPRFFFQTVNYFQIIFFLINNSYSYDVFLSLGRKFLLS